MIVAFIIAFPVIYFLPELLAYAGGFETRGWSLATNGVAALALSSVLTYFLTPLNRRLLDWRKARGRDIEEEERFETDHGMIRLTPNDEDRQTAPVNLKDAGF